MANRTTIALPSNEDDEIEVTGDGTFWDVGGYKPVVERIDNGSVLCDELAKMVNERAALEKSYAKHLRAWSSKWEQHLASKSNEFGTLKTGWGGLLADANTTADFHAEVCNNLISKVESSVMNWKNESYHKSMFRWKETRVAEEEFQKAQKQWAKLKGKVNKRKKLYHHASHVVAQYQQQLAQQETDVNITEEAKKKKRQQLGKAEKEQQSAREKYEKALQDISAHNNDYQQMMTQVFDRCQGDERKRIDFFRNTLFEYHTIIDLPAKPGYIEAFARLRGVVECVNADTDLIDYASKFGTLVPTHWPQFEEYTGMNTDSSLNLDRSTSSAPPAEAAASHTPVGRVASADDFADDFNDQPPQSAQSQGTGQRVRAVYDYTATDEQELSFREGDVIEMLHPEDEHGWCTGLLDGRQGLYPASYVEPC
eukprot:Colp12_sorted_trinity150504_noHs@11809